MGGIFLLLFHIQFSLRTIKLLWPIPTNAEQFLAAMQLNSKIIQEKTRDNPYYSNQFISILRSLNHSTYDGKKTICNKHTIKLLQFN